MGFSPDLIPWAMPQEKIYSKVGENKEERRGGGGKEEEGGEYNGWLLWRF